MHDQLLKFELLRKSCVWF